MRHLLPSFQEIKSARKEFERRAPRSLFYRAATELVTLAFSKKTKLSLAEALAVLLQTWNRVYYQYHPFNQKHFSDIELLLKRHLGKVLPFRTRVISSFVEIDRKSIEFIFFKFEHLLGPVGAAKSLHLLAPRFFPLWDGKIATQYGCRLGRIGTNAHRYLDFIFIAKSQCANLNRNKSFTGNALKALDEFNYCKFTLKLKL